MNIAIVGCGALANVVYLPILKDLGIIPTLLVDPNVKATQKLADRYGVRSVLASPEEINGQADAVIVASPNFLHVSHTLKLLEKGMHILLEKPFAATEQEGVKLIQAAKDQKVVLQIGMMRRFWKINRAVKNMLSKGVFGKLELIDMQEGGVMNWPAQSFAVFNAKQWLGGVYIDTGAHTLDLFCWWADDEISQLEYEDDNKGGVEADSHLQVIFKRTGAKGVVRVSRIRKMPNQFLIKGSEGWIKVKPYMNMFEASSKKIENEVYNYFSAQELKAQGFNDLYQEQVKTWIDSIQQNKEISVPAESVLPSITLIEKSYQHRKQMHYPF